MATATATRERPLIFSAPMVRALLAGTKTMTRRVIKPQPDIQWSIPPAMLHEGWLNRWGCTRDAESIRCPFEVGMRLWVKESVWTHPANPFNPRGAGRHHYDADIDDVKRTELRTAGWRRGSPMLMRRGFSRITLTIESVRAERLTDISEEDAKAEGVPRDEEACDHVRHSCASVGCFGKTHKSSFLELWHQLHGDKPAQDWPSNPWVFVLGFRVEQPHA